jgi:hypothetical protein
MVSECAGDDELDALFPRLGSRQVKRILHKQYGISFNNLISEFLHNPPTVVILLAYVNVQFGFWFVKEGGGGKVQSDVPCNEWSFLLHSDRHSTFWHPLPRVAVLLLVASQSDGNVSIVACLPCCFLLFNSTKGETQRQRTR